MSLDMQQFFSLKAEITQKSMKMKLMYISSFVDILFFLNILLHKNV